MPLTRWKFKMFYAVEQLWALASTTFGYVRSIIHQKSCWWSLDALIGTNTAQRLYISCSYFCGGGRMLHKKHFENGAPHADADVAQQLNIFSKSFCSKKKKNVRPYYGIILKMFLSSCVSSTSLRRRRQPVGRNGRKSLSEPLATDDSPFTFSPVFLLE